AKPEAAVELSVHSHAVRVRAALANDRGVLPRAACRAFAACRAGRSAAADQTNQSGGYETRAHSSPRTDARARRMLMDLPSTRQSRHAGTGTDCLRAAIKKASLPVFRFDPTFPDM